MEKIIKKARAKASSYGKKLSDVIFGGEGSITDTTLVRRFSPVRPEEISYESRSKVFINRNLSIKNAILDLAHELTHFSFRTTFNPYHGHFDLKDFITSTVEGKGGEVDAYLVECRVLLELFGDQVSDSNCHRILNRETGKIDRKKGIDEFYQLGKYYKSFNSQIKKHNLAPKNFSQTSAKSAHFISSAYGLPYPLAAVYEYESIMRRVCKNDERRLNIMRNKKGRMPSTAQQKEFSTFFQFHLDRCRYFGD